MEEKFKLILQEIESRGQRKRNDHIMLVDGLNTLLRAFAVVNTINPKGNHVGGITGFLKSLGYVMRQFDPTRIILVWDGIGGSQSRKIVNPNYKAQREHASVIHWDTFDSKEEEMQAVWDQADRLVDYLECLPITYVRVDKLEADDVIAYLARCASYADHKVTIVSSDKDFLQIVDENIQVYSPTKKVTYDKRTAFEFLKVLPENYNIVKAVTGDKSDNLRGIRGAGIATLIKLFPKLVTDPGYSLQGLYEDCTAYLGKKALAAHIIHEWSLVESNFKLMNLNSTMLTPEERKLVRALVARPTPCVQVGPFLHYLQQDCIEGITNNTEEWLSTFNYLQTFSE